MIFYLRLVVFSLALCLIQCGPQSVVETASSRLTACPDKINVIGVRDGFFSLDCGCAEIESAIVVAKQVNCTIERGESVVFYFHSFSLRHQILSTGEPSFPSSPLSDPSSQAPVRSHLVEFDLAGTYEFKDAFSPEQYGSIIVL